MYTSPVVLQAVTMDPLFHLPLSLISWAAKEEIKEQ